MPIIGRYRYLSEVLEAMRKIRRNVTYEVTAVERSGPRLSIELGPCIRENSELRSGLDLFDKARKLLGLSAWRDRREPC